MDGSLGQSNSGRGDSLVRTGLVDVTGTAIRLGAELGVTGPPPGLRQGASYRATVEGADDDDVGPYLVLRTPDGERRYSRPQWVRVLGADRS